MRASYLVELTELFDTRCPASYPIFTQWYATIKILSSRTEMEENVFWWFQDSAASNSRFTNTIGHQVDLAATVLNLYARDTRFESCPNIDPPCWGSAWFSPIPSDKYRYSIWLRQWPLPSRLFPIHHFSIALPFDALKSFQPHYLTDVSTSNLPTGKGRPALKADNLTAIREPIVLKMWEPRRLITLWASTVSYRDSFTFLCICLLVIEFIGVGTVLGDATVRRSD
jgi:hypothetical protein